MLSKKGLLGGGLYIGIVIATSISNVVAAGIADKRNELNQIYWRIQANNRLNDLNLEKEHEWIKQDRYRESIVKVIGKAIGDCVTEQGVFANKKAPDGLITFEGTSPELYARRHWNAVLLCNYIDVRLNAPNNLSLKDVLRCCVSAVYKHYAYMYEDRLSKGRFYSDLEKSSNDIREYADALRLETILRKCCYCNDQYIKTRNLSYLTPGITRYTSKIERTSDSYCLVTEAVNEVQVFGQRQVRYENVFLKYDNSKLYIMGMDKTEDKTDGVIAPTERFYKEENQMAEHCKYVVDLLDGLAEPITKTMYDNGQIQLELHEQQTRDFDMKVPEENIVMEEEEEMEEQYEEEMIEPDFDNEGEFEEQIEEEQVNDEGENVEEEVFMELSQDEQNFNNEEEHEEQLEEEQANDGEENVEEVFMELSQDEQNFNNEEEHEEYNNDQSENNKEQVSEGGSGDEEEGEEVEVEEQK